ncbi:MAG: hypothetical protein LZF60_340090 [Nitrospira sp.]|nr:MAG: hypothetical protein LZF60_340090 [Nitrospira sp.]
MSSLSLEGTPLCDIVRLLYEAGNRVKWNPLWSRKDVMRVPREASFEFRSHRCLPYLTVEKTFR